MTERKALSSTPLSMRSNDGRISCLDCIMKAKNVVEPCNQKGCENMDYEDYSRYCEKHNDNVDIVYAIEDFKEALVEFYRACEDLMEKVGYQSDLGELLKNHEYDTSKFEDKINRELEYYQDQRDQYYDKISSPEGLYWEKLERCGF